MAQLSYPLDDTLYTAADAQIWHSTRTQGVYSSDKDLILTPTIAMTVNLSPGVAWIKYNRFTNAVYANTTDLPFTIETAHGILSRIDRLVVRWDNVTNTITGQIKKGTATANPVAPALQRDAEAYEIGLYDIRVKPGTLQITAADFTPLCLNETLCGVMRDGVTGIPTQNLYDTWWAWFSNLKQKAEKQAGDFTEWITLFKQQGETDFDQWFSSFTAANTQVFVDWYNTFKNTNESDFNTWFENLQNTLNENQASNLFNKIEQHEQKKITNLPDGVHSMRLKEGKFQVFLGIGWATLATVPIGFTAGYFDGLFLNAASFDAVSYTAGNFDTQIEVEG